MRLDVTRSEAQTIASALIVVADNLSRPSAVHDLLTLKDKIIEQVRQEVARERARSRVAAARGSGDL